MRIVLLLFIAVGICLSAAQAATPAPTWSASGPSPTLSSNVTTPASNGTSPTSVPTTVKATKAPTAEPSVQTTAPTATRTADPTVRATASRTPTVVPTTPAPTTQVTTARPTSSSTPVPTTALPTSTSTPVPTTALPTSTVDPNLTATPPIETVNVTSPPTPENNETLNFTVPTTWPYVTITEYPTATDTPDIDPGMTPYAGSTAEVTPVGEIPPFDPNATPTEGPAGMLPVFTAEIVSSPPFELPPGMLDPEVVPSPTETVEPVPTLLEPGEPGASLFFPRWLSYLLFIFLGISGVAGLAMVGSYLGSRPPTTGPTAAPQSPTLRTQNRFLVSPEAGELPIDQQILVDRISSFSPETMHVERLGRNLLRLEQVAQARSGDRSVRLGRLLSLSTVPSVAIPAAALAWARAHGFRVLAVDGSGMALVMPALSSVNHSELGVLPVARMVDGSSPVPMPVVPPEAGPSPDPRSSFLAGMGYYSSTELSE